MLNRQSVVPFLLVVPFLVVAILGFLLYKAQRPRVSGDLAAERKLSPHEPALAPRSEDSTGVLARY